MLLMAMDATMTARALAAFAWPIWRWLIITAMLFDTRKHRSGQGRSASGKSDFIVDRGNGLPTWEV